MSNINFATLRNIHTDESALYRNRQTGFSFELVRDGKVEPSVQDVVAKAFPDSQVSDDIASLKTFVARHAKLASACVPQPDAAVRLTHNDRDHSIETVFLTRIPGQGPEFTDLRQDIEFLADAGTGTFRLDSLQESAQFNFA